MLHADDQLPPLPPHVQRSMETNGTQISGPNAFQTPSSAPVHSTPSTQTSNGVGEPGAPGSNESPEQYAIPGIPASTGHTFGVDLGEQLSRDGTEVPLVVQKCAQAIEAFGEFKFDSGPGPNRQAGHLLTF